MPSDYGCKCQSLPDHHVDETGSHLQKIGEKPPWWSEGDGGGKPKLPGDKLIMYIPPKEKTYTLLFITSRVRPGLSIKDLFAGRSPCPLTMAASASRCQITMLMKQAATCKRLVKNAPGGQNPFHASLTGLQETKRCR